MAQNHATKAVPPQGTKAPPIFTGETIAAIARMERVSPAIVKATAMSVGGSRPQLIAAIRAGKARN
ncbi:hypothetical protein A8950_1134 [Dongia mobilis]|uniref:Uncharacterized protein n=1 Tax=Dongia mobilis TaxID=578943 RepID=A0A4R6WSI8_9PROT|nr:hypothetical protein [Dongia mobilis]TDQ84575.1 hypothetical protein A8950_1134 [Dongia mobilis]